MATQLVLTLGEILMVWRVRAGFTQADLAAELDMGRNTVARWEAGQGRPRWRDVQAWAEACDQYDAELARPEFEAAVAARKPMGRPRTEVTHRKGAVTPTVRTAHEVRRRVRRKGESLSERLIA
jgi:transcriptional regulator with XRE-family HTH domain